MTTTNVNNAEEFEEKLTEKLTDFMEQNEAFNVQGSWTGDDGVTVGVLVDFGIQDRDDGGYYVGSVSAPFEDNYEAVLGEKDAKKLVELDCTPEKEEELRDKLGEKLAESDTMTEAENALIRAIRKVFDVGPYHNTHPEVLASDIDMCATVSIAYSRWPTHDSIDFERGGE